MSNPFKVGDKLVRNNYNPGEWRYSTGRVVTVARIEGDRVICAERYNAGDMPDRGLAYQRFRAAVKGVDYDVPKFNTSNPQRTESVYAGHHRDGSGIQNHSCGELYPYVLVYRDKKHGRNADGRYDVGVIGPNNQDPIWCKSFDHAVNLITTLKETRA